MIEKSTMISEARRKLEAEYEKKLADYAVQKKMYFSRQNCGA